MSPSSREMVKIRKENETFFRSEVYTIFVRERLPERASVDTSFDPYSMKPDMPCHVSNALMHPERGQHSTRRFYLKQNVWSHFHRSWGVVLAILETNLHWCFQILSSDDSRITILVPASHSEYSANCLRAPSLHFASSSSSENVFRSRSQKGANCREQFSRQNRSISKSVLPSICSSSANALSRIATISMDAGR